MIEILVTVAILAIGFLTATKMQMTSMRYSQSAYFESQAYFMAGDMIDRLKANIAGVRSGEYDDLSTASGLSDPGCSNKQCTPGQTASQDRYDWSRSFHSSDANSAFVPALPSSDTVAAVGRVTRSGSGQYSVAIVWADGYGGDDDGKRTLRVDLVVED